MMQILITGGAGFLGTALANRLLNEGHAVRVLDDLSAGTPAGLHPGVALTQGNILDKPTLWRLLNQVDCVYHLAARVSVPESIMYTREYNDINVGGTVALMEAMRDTGIKRVVFASSGAIYGEQPFAFIPEDLPPHPTSPYGVSKLSAEYYIRSIGQLWGIETLSLRIFNAFGPGQPCPATHPPVIPQFLRQVLGKGSITVFGTGQQVRDFVYLDDVVEALVLASQAEIGENYIINIGSGRGVSINQLIEICADIAGYNPQVLNVNSESSGVSKLVANITLAQRVLGYSPQVDLESGLRQLIQADPHLRALL